MRSAQSSRREGGRDRRPAPAPQLAIQSRSGPGAPLEDSLRNLLELRFGADLGDVRLHHDAGGREASRGLGMSAYTEGQDIHFSPRAFQPHTAAGLRLLAHEVSHTVQQREAAGSGVHSTASDGHGWAERDASRAADAVMQGRDATVSTTTAVRVARDGPGGFDESAIAGPLAEVLAAMGKVMTEGGGVGDFPAAFRAVNGLSMADMLAVFAALERKHQLSVLAGSIQAAEGVNRPRIEVAIAAVQLRAGSAEPLPESRTAELGPGYADLPPDQQEDVKRLLTGPAIGPPPPPPPPPPRPAPNLSTVGSGAFEPGIYKGSATTDPQWVERDIVNYKLSEAAPWTFTLIYGDRSELTIPLEQMSDAAPRGMMTFYRRQHATQRIIPFQANPLDPAVRKPSGATGETWEETLARVGTPTFNNAVTPLIMNYLRDAQFIFLALGMLHVMEVQLMNPMMGGGARPGAGSLGRTGAGAAARGVAQAGGKELLTFVEIGAGDLQASIRLARQGGVRVIAVDTVEPAAGAVKELESLGGTFVKGEASKLAAGTADHVFQYFPWRIGGSGSYATGGTWRLVQDAVKLLKSNGAAHFVTEDLATAQFLMKEASKKGLRTVLTETTAGIAAKGASGAGVPGFSASTGVFQVNIYL